MHSITNFFLSAHLRNGWLQVDWTFFLFPAACSFGCSALCGSERNQVGNIGTKSCRKHHIQNLSLPNQSSSVVCRLVVPGWGDCWFLIVIWFGFHQPTKLQIVVVSCPVQVCLQGTDPFLFNWTAASQAAIKAQDGMSSAPAWSVVKLWWSVSQGCLEPVLWNFSGNLAEHNLSGTSYGVQLC